MHSFPQFIAYSKAWEKKKKKRDWIAIQIRGASYTEIVAKVLQFAVRKQRVNTCNWIPQMQPFPPTLEKANTAREHH